MAPTHRRGPWVPEEDQLLVQLVREQGPNNWVRIAQHMHYRSPKQCRERFHQNLKPSLNRDPITSEEGLLIERMVDEMGKRWAEIARRLGNRSDNAVKNWWNGSMNRKRRGLSTSNPSRTFNGRIEAPYQRASVSMGSARCSRLPSLSQDMQFSWANAPAVHLDRSSFSAALESATDGPRLTPIYTLPSINRPIDTPLTSPAYSEASNAASAELPSMVSDHENSVASASPRTLPSPQLLSLPVEIRRPSITAEEYYHGGRTLETLSDLAVKSQPQSQSQSQSWNQPSWSKAEPSSSETSTTRDSRMGVNNLLN